MLTPIVVSSYFLFGLLMRLYYSFCSCPPMQFTAFFWAKQKISSLIFKYFCRHKVPYFCFQYNPRIVNIDNFIDLNCLYNKIISKSFFARLGIKGKILNYWHTGRTDTPKHRPKLFLLTQPKPKSTNHAFSGPSVQSELDQ